MDYLLMGEWKERQVSRDVFCIFFSCESQGVLCCHGNRVADRHTGYKKNKSGPVSANKAATQKLFVFYLLRNASDSSCCLFTFLHRDCFLFVWRMFLLLVLRACFEFVNRTCSRHVASVLCCKIVMQKKKGRGEQIGKLCFCEKGNLWIVL